MKHLASPRILAHVTSSSLASPSPSLKGSNITMYIGPEDSSCPSSHLQRHAPKLLPLQTLSRLRFSPSRAKRYTKARTRAAAEVETVAIHPVVRFRYARLIPSGNFDSQAVSICACTLGSTGSSLHHTRHDCLERQNPRQPPRLSRYTPGLTSWLA